MLSTVEHLNNLVNAVVWGPPLMILLIGTGVYLSFRLGWIQLTHFLLIWRSTLGRLLSGRTEADAGELSAFQAVSSAMAAFRGVRRRQEIAGEAAGVLVIDDFAHHPTAVAETIAAVRAAWPVRRLWAVFEPRSQTSRRRVFLEEFARALAGADRVLLPDLYHPEKIPEEERLSAADLVELINRNRGDRAASYLPEVDDIAAVLARDAAEGDIVLVMSNGSFGGLPGKIVAGLRRR